MKFRNDAGVNYEKMKEHIANFKAMMAFLDSIGVKIDYTLWARDFPNFLSNVEGRLGAAAYEEALK